MVKIDEVVGVAEDCFSTAAAADDDRGGGLQGRLFQVRLKEVDGCCTIS